MADALALPTLGFLVGNHHVFSGEFDASPQCGVHTACREIIGGRVARRHQAARNVDDRAVVSDPQPVHPLQALCLGAPQILQVAFGALAGQGDIRFARLSGAQRHHPVLRGANAGLERFLKVVPSDGRVALALLLGLPATVHLQGRLHIVGRGGVVQRW